MNPGNGPGVLKMFKFWKYSKHGEDQETAEEKRLREKYQAFLGILSENEHALQLMSDMEKRFYSHQLVSIPFIRNVTRNLSRTVMTVVDNLNLLADNRYEKIALIAEEIDQQVREIVSGRKEPLFTPIVIPLSRLSVDLVDKVGSKMANLGELRNRLQIKVPDGFALTACAYQHFLDYNSLTPKVNAVLAELDINDSRRLLDTERKIKALFRRCLVPPEIVHHIEQQRRRLERERSHPVRWAIRSSAIGEDQENSFAGQFSSLLNVPSSQLLEQYKEVLAGKYNARALTYRHIKRIRDEDVNLSLGIIEMIPAVTSGVIYTADPLHPDSGRLIINAVWGIGQLLAEGVISADTYIVKCDDCFAIEQMDIADKEICLLPADDGGVCHRRLSAKQCRAPCLEKAQIEQLVRTAMAIQDHFECPQDIEWCFDREGNLFILQARPLRLVSTVHKETVQPVAAPVLIDEAQPVNVGVAIGRVCKIGDARELLAFPQGGVLVAKKSSPRLVKAMHRVVAVVIEGGNPTDHMAPIVREFGVPCLVKARDAFSLLEDGQEVTVDAYQGKVYQGRVPELHQQHNAVEALPFDPSHTESYQLLERLLKNITPLHLTDPRSKSFTPENCRSWHDVTRFCHEAALNEMFNLSESQAIGRARNVYRVKSELPLDLYVLDLFNNTITNARNKTVDPQQVHSLPFQALWSGASHRDIPWNGPPAETGSQELFTGLTRTPADDMQRIDTRSFAVVSPEYLNLSLSMGSHHIVLDAYLSEQPFNNYVTISFRGGTTRIEQRSLKTRFAAELLRRLDFDVHRTNDFIKARIKAESALSLAEKLDIIGRMLGVTRFLDVALRNEQMVEKGVEQFLEGDYSLRFLADAEPRVEV